MNVIRLLRYNLRVVLSHNWWLLVFPVVVSQASVFWTIITRRFTPSLPAESVELITPLLSAFLCSHVMVAEYHSRVGAILASKPLHIGKVVLLRLAAVMALVWLLELASLTAYYFGMQPFDLRAPFLASIPSTLFLSMLALTFATLFRNPFAGFSIAALYWAMDLPPGPPANAFLSLRSYSTFLSSTGPELDALVSPWWIAKALLLVGAILLYLLHGRLVFRLGISQTMRARRRSLGWAAGLFGLYVVSGACAKVIYGYANRGLLDPNDGTWFRQQFSPYGPIPVALAFGPAFSRYLGDTNGWRSAADEGDRLGDTLRHHRELRDVVEHMPNSIWAPSAAELLGRLTSRQGATVEERIAIFQRVADRYPHSPYVDVSIREEARVLDGAEQLDSARAEYEKMLTLHPSSPFRLEALRYIVYNERSHHNLPGMLRWARKWLDGAPIQERFVAHSLIAEALLAQDDVTGAKNEAKKTLESASAFEQAMRDNRIQASPSSLVKWQREAQQARQEARAIEQRP